MDLLAIPMLFVDIRYLFPLIALIAVVGLISAVELVGALLAVIRSDHTNPFARWFVDWIDRHQA